MQHIAGSFAAGVALNNLVMLISYAMSINMCIMEKDFKVILLLLLLSQFWQASLAAATASSASKRPCKVVPLKARPVIKADFIFSATVKEFIKKPLFLLKRRKRGNFFF